MKLKYKYTGRGIGVAVLDTGIFPHVDFDQRIVCFRDFVQKRTGPMMITATVPMWPGSSPGAEGFPGDLYGHSSRLSSDRPEGTGCGGQRDAAQYDPGAGVVIGVLSTVSDQSGQYFCRFHDKELPSAGRADPGCGTSLGCGDGGGDGCGKQRARSWKRHCARQQP